MTEVQSDARHHFEFSLQKGMRAATPDVFPYEQFRKHVKSIDHTVHFTGN